MDINDKIAENLGLVYAQLKRFNLTQDQDAESIAYEALYRAILTFKEDSGNAFSTYAICVIANALRQHLRLTNKKKQLQYISFYTPLSNEEDGKYLVDTLGELETVESIVCNNELLNAASIAIDNVIESITSATQRNIIIVWRKSEFKLTQKEIADQIGVTQPTVSRAISAFKYRLKLELEEYL